MIAIGLAELSCAFTAQAAQAVTTMESRML